jgi:hypothetical protein
MRRLVPCSTLSFALALGELLTTACGVPSPANSTGTTTGETAAEEAGLDEASGEGNGVGDDEAGVSPTQCEAEIAALAPFVSRPDGGCSVVVRVSHETLALLGYQTTCSATPDAPLDEAEARALSECCKHAGIALDSPAAPDLWVLFMGAPDDQHAGRVALVSSNVSARIFEGSSGHGHAPGDITFPDDWIEPGELGSACGEVPMPPLASWDLANDGAPLPEDRLREVWDVVGSTAIPFAMSAVGQPRHAAVLRYPRRLTNEGKDDAFDPSTAEYLVVIEGGVDDDPGRKPGD